MMESTILLYGLISFVVYTIADYGWTFFRKGLRTLPGPLLARFSGLYRLSITMNGDSPQNYRKLHDKYGKIVRIGPNHVSVSDSAEIPKIYGVGSKYLKTPFYSTLTPTYKGEKHESMFSTRDPAYHKAIKTPVASLFSMTNMKNFEPYADECTKIFLSAMQDLEGQAIDLGVWLQWYAFDVIAYISFQRRFGFLEERRDIGGNIDALNKALDYVKVIGQYPGLHPWLLGNKRLVGFIKKMVTVPDPLESFLDITVDEMARYDREDKHDNGRTDFLAQLRTRESKMSDGDVRNHLSNNILAGSDTTAISLRACFYYLIKTPSAYKKVIDEILAAEKAGELSPSITYEECVKLPYLQATMKEAMRLHPGVGFPLERFVPDGGATICGQYLPAGAIVSISAPVVHNNKRVWGDDADEFRPERWIESDAEQLKLMDRSFLAFGYGSRTCIGKNISMMEMGKVVPQVLRSFDLEWASPDTEWKLNAAWFWKQSGLIVKFKSRQHD